MTTYTITAEQLASVVTAGKQLIDLGDGKAAATLAWATLKVAPDEFPSMPESWSVTVHVGCNRVLTIEDSAISGAANFDESVILGAAKHLLAFIGYGLPATDFYPEAAARQPACETSNDDGLIGGPSFRSPDEGGVPCPDCAGSESAALTDEQIDAVCAPGRAQRWRGDGRRYDRDTVRLALSALSAAQPARVEGQPLPDGVVVSAYRIKGGVLPFKVERVQQVDGADLWAVRHGSDVLNVHGEWEWEPMPSGRDDAFLARCRFLSSGAAIAAAMAQGKR